MRQEFGEHFSLGRRSWGIEVEGLRALVAWCSSGVVVLVGGPGSSLVVEMVGLMVVLPAHSWL